MAVILLNDDESMLLTEYFVGAIHPKDAKRFGWVSPGLSSDRRRELEPVLNHVLAASVAGASIVHPPMFGGVVRDCLESAVKQMEDYLRDTDSTDHNHRFLGERPKMRQAIRLMSDVVAGWDGDARRS